MSQLLSGRVAEKPKDALSKVDDEEKIIWTQKTPLLCHLPRRRTLSVLSKRSVPSKKMQNKRLRITILMTVKR